jgi:hypothetical protein
MFIKRYNIGKKCQRPIHVSSANSTKQSPWERRSAETETDDRQCEVEIRLHPTDEAAHRLRLMYRIALLDIILLPLYTFLSRPSVVDTLRRQCDHGEMYWFMSVCPEPRVQISGRPLDRMFKCLGELDRDVMRHAKTSTYFEVVAA